MPRTPTTTIDQALEAFLADQRERLSTRTLRNYEDVIDLLRHCLNGYGPNLLDEPDRKRWEEAYQDDEEAFCYFTGVDGPVRVTRQASDLAKPGWDVTLIRHRGTWKVLEVGNVYPH